MTKQDYLIRVIQEIISLTANMILNKKKSHRDEWTKYDYLIRQILGLPQEQLQNMNPGELISHYKGDPNRMGEIGLAVMTLLEISDEMEFNVLQKPELHQDGLILLKYVQKESSTFSIQRTSLIRMTEINEYLKI